MPKKLGNHSRDLELDDLVLVVTETRQDLVAVLVEFGTTFGCSNRSVELHRGRDEAVGRAVGGRCLADVAVRQRLRILDHFERVLGEGPLALEVLEACAPLAQRGSQENLGQDLARYAGVLCQQLRRREARVVDEVFAADDPASSRPLAEALEAREGQEPPVLGPIGTDQRIERSRGATLARSPRVVEL